MLMHATPHPAPPRTPWNLSFQYHLDGRLLVVLDDALPEPEIRAIAERWNAAAYPRSESDREETRHIRTFAADVELDRFRKELLYARMEQAVAHFFPAEDLTAYRSYCNLILYGDMTHAHRDCHPDRTDVTTLFYANSTWDKEWGGETVFFNDQGDSILAISPRPGRLVVFRGAIEHRVGVPARTCFESRLTIACKFKAPGEWR
jgi:Rps23 Pro-64 3,4-dihydroxylase Tpa1-like proline 4-hydroxylase